MTILLYRVYDDSAITRYMTILLYRAIWCSWYNALYDDPVTPPYMMNLLYAVCERYVVIMLPRYRNKGHIIFYIEKLNYFS